MFDKKCSKCNTNIKENFDYCPSCGLNLKSKYDESDYGLLGKNDEILSREPNFFDGLGLGGLPIGKILKGAMKELPSVMKMIERQMEESLKENEKRNRGPNNRMNVQFFVNGKKIEPQFNNKIEKDPSIRRVNKIVSKDKMKKLSKFPKVEPVSEVRRLSRGIIYNIHVPGVKNIEDVFINQLENSIEVRALTKNKVYSKTLELSLPLKRWDLVKDNLILELVTE